MVKLIKSFWHACRWTILVTSFGAFQVLIVWFFSFVIPEYPFRFDKILLDGVLLFFSVSMFVSVFLEFYLDNNINLPKTLHLLFILIPLVSLVLSALSYAALVFQIDKIEIEALLQIQNLLLILCVGYRLVLKTIIYYWKHNLISQKNYGFR